MRVCVLYFGVLKDLVGHGRWEMDLAESASVAELLEVHRGLVKGRESLWDSIAVAVNQEYAKAGDVLKDGDEVALLPPVSGGIGIGEHTPGAKAPEFGWRGEGQA
jgi:molybdopterin converting factor subunit 1